MRCAGYGPDFTCDQVFKANALSMLRSGLHWGLSLMSGGLLLAPPRALFDNTPLRKLLRRNIRWEHLRTSVNRGALRALALCATSYSTAASVAFPDGYTFLLTPNATLTVLPTLRKTPYDPVKSFDAGGPRRRPGIAASSSIPRSA